MNVLLYDPLLTGHHSTYAASIAGKLTGEGEEVTFLTTKPDDREQPIRDAGATIKYTGTHSESSKPWHRVTRPYWRFRKCMEYAAEQDADVVHALFIDQIEVQLLFSLLKKDPQRLVFGTIFNPRHFRTPANPLKSAYRTVNRRSLRRLLSTGRLATLFIHSSAFKSRLVSYGVESSRVRIIPDPVEIPDERPVKREAREHLDIPKQGKVLLFFGGFRHEKGTDILLEAIRSIDCQNLSVVFAGSPSDTTEQDIREVQRDVPDDRVILRAEFIPHKMVNRYFAAADAIVLPYRSEYSGTSGILQRAAAMNRPVIATAVGDVGSAVENNGLGIVIEPDSVSAIQNGISQFCRRQNNIEQRVDQHATSYAESNSYNMMVNQIYDTYCDNYFKK